jgi:hypothetical protein
MNVSPSLRMRAEPIGVKDVMQKARSAVFAPDVPTADFCRISKNSWMPGIKQHKAGHDEHERS